MEVPTAFSMGDNAMTQRTLFFLLVAMLSFEHPHWAFSQNIEAKLASGKQEPTGLALEARAELATWYDFPGFTADIEVNLTGKKATGRVIVDSTGRLFVEHLPSQSSTWAKSKLCFLIRQQLPGVECPQKRWTFAPREPSHADLCISPVDRPFDLCWRIRGSMLTTIEVRTKDTRSCMHYLAFQKTLEGRSLPTVLVVHAWNGPGEELKTSETQVRVWKRIRGIDLPVSVDVLAAEFGSPQKLLGSLRLSNHQVFDSTARQIAYR